MGKIVRFPGADIQPGQQEDMQDFDQYEAEAPRREWPRPLAYAGRALRWLAYMVLMLCRPVVSLLSVAVYPLALGGLFFWYATGQTRFLAALAMSLAIFALKLGYDRLLIWLSGDTLILFN